jgi:ATP-dependent protease ClpP protease subunit
VTEPSVLRLMNRRGEYSVIRNAADSSVTEILLYDEIGEDPFFGGGISAKQFVEDLQAVDTAEIHLRINSPGGNVFEGITMLNAIRRHPAKVTAYVDGIAASAASFLAMGADSVVMSRNSQMMIHDASGIAMGNAEVMLDLGDRLNRASDNIASVYAEKAGGDPAQWREAMQAETWYYDKEAVAAGLADRVETNKTASDKVKNSFNLSLYAYAGRAEAPAPYLPAKPPETTNQEGTDLMSDTLNLRERLGLKADATDEEVNAKLDAVLKNSEAPAEEPAEDPKPDEDPEPEEPTAAPGTVLVDEEQFNALKVAAEQGQQARAQQLAEHRTTLVTNAIADGRISPARKADWLATLEKDPGAEATLTGLPKGLVPVEAKGYTGGLGDVGEDADDTTYNALYGEGA